MHPFLLDAKPDEGEVELFSTFQPHLNAWSRSVILSKSLEMLAVAAFRVTLFHTLCILNTIFQIAYHDPLDKDMSELKNKKKEQR